MDWVEINAIATSLYTLFFLVGLWFAYVQARGFEKNRKLQATILIFEELKSTINREARKRLYKQVPNDISDLRDEYLEKYLNIVQEAVLSFDRISYLIQTGHMDSDSILELCWRLIWRSWKKSENLINWVREKRSEPMYLHRFQELFDLSESYRMQNGYEEPKIY
ncbi:MAG: hypothetical protein Q7K54_02770 [Candidatus Parcubacteria bacterium]|nr:hypothetical protein [Candidatus Parcubacteria bacterium]